jgi:hypothetical protein
MSDDTFEASNLLMYRHYQLCLDRLGTSVHCIRLYECVEHPSSISHEHRPYQTHKTLRQLRNLGIVIVSLAARHLQACQHAALFRQLVGSATYGRSLNATGMDTVLPLSSLVIAEHIAYPAFDVPRKNMRLGEARNQALSP